MLILIPGVVAQDVTCGTSKDSQAEQCPLDLVPFTKIKNLSKLKLRSIAGTLRVENLSRSLDLFATNFAESLRIMVSNNNSFPFYIVQYYLIFEKALKY